MALNHSPRWILHGLGSRRVPKQTNNMPNFYKSIRKCLSTQKSGKEWRAPDGKHTGIMIYNTATRSKVPLTLQMERNLKWYACGPTVYDEPHIGHACSYVRLDIIRRLLSRVFNINVTYMMNITDIDDKLINKANQTGEPVDHISKHYESRFVQAMNRLNVLQPTITHRVTDHMPCIVRFIQKLIDNGTAYATDKGNVYFHCSKYGDYCNLSRQFEHLASNEESKLENSISDKLDQRDFALWKAKRAGEPWWEAPWGDGRPGWHVECSAMASEVFGDSIDIHSGGSDLLFPHHENELAQSNCYHHTDQWVNYWLHTGLLKSTHDTEKMSKSLGNVISIDDLLEKYTTNQFRIFCLLSHYRTNVEYSDDTMKKPVIIHKKLKALKSLADSYIQGTSSVAASHCIDDRLLLKSLEMTQSAVHTAVSDDFDTKTMMSAVMSLVHVSNIELCKRNTQKVIKARSVHSVGAVINYIEDMMHNVGVTISQQSSDVGAGDRQQMTYILDSVTAFRDKVRDFSLGGVAANASSEEKSRIRAHRKAHSALLTSCDQLRDELSTLANVDIKDGKDNRSRWEIRESALESQMTSTDDLQTTSTDDLQTSSTDDLQQSDKRSSSC